MRFFESLVRELRRKQNAATAIMPRKPKIDPEVSAAAAALGSKGGKNGVGSSKRRNPLHYGIVLAEARRKAIMRKRMAS